MRKQVTTIFTYVVIDEFGKHRLESGSYIGFKLASMRTIRGFINKAIRAYIPLSRLDTVVILNSQRSDSTPDPNLGYES